MQVVDVDLDKLDPPSSRPFADPAKLARMGQFDPAKCTPIIVEKSSGGRFIIQEGMTRVERARQAGLTSLPAYVFPRSGA